MYPSPSGLRRSPVQDIQFDQSISGELQYQYRDWHAILAAKKSDNIQDLHVAGALDFFDPIGFGANLEPITKVIGFVPHAFHYPPRASLEDPQAWTIERLELVSLLKFDEPRVYVLDHLPRMDQLSSEMRQRVRWMSSNAIRSPSCGPMRTWW